MLRMLQYLIIVFTVSLLAFSNTAAQDDPKTDLEQVKAEINSIDQQMTAATEAKDREKYNQLNTKREELISRAKELQKQIGAQVENAKQVALAQNEYNEGNTQLSIGNYQAAIEHYQKSLEIEPDNAAAHFNIGYAYLKQRQNNEAKQAFIKTIEVDPQYIKAYVPLGQLESDKNKALEYYHKAIELDPGQAKAHFGIGTIFLRQEKFAPAATAYRDAVTADDSFIDAWVGLGRALSGLNKNSEAIEALQKATSFDPKSKKENQEVAAAYFHLAEIYNKDAQKKYSSALTSAENCLKLKKYYKNSAGAYYEMGFALMNLGRKAEAKEAFTSAKSDRNWQQRAQHFIDKIDGKIQ